MFPEAKWNAPSGTSFSCQSGSAGPTSTHHLNGKTGCSKSAQKPVISVRMEKGKLRLRISIPYNRKLSSEMNCTI